MIVLKAVIPLQADKKEAFMEFFMPIVQASRQEAGINTYLPLFEAENPNVLMMFEEYQDQAAFDSHSEAEHTKKLFAAMPDYLADKPQITIYTVTEVKRPE